MVIFVIKCVKIIIKKRVVRFIVILDDRMISNDDEFIVF